jgi:crotonobetainyl-CoA hydratase
VQAGKHAVLTGLRGSLENALSTKYEPIEAYASSEDVKEGRLAFTERRTPRWTGR